MMIFPKLIKPGPVRALFVFVALLFGVVSASAQDFSRDIVTIKTGKGEFVFNTELAITNRQRQMGLMFRKSMAQDEAMLFTWQTPQPISMWMKNTLISLDMIFIRQGGVVANIGKATTPLSLDSVSSDGDVAAVLEVIAGTAERIGLKKGDLVVLPASK